MLQRSLKAFLILFLTLTAIILFVTGYNFYRLLYHPMMATATIAPPVIIQINKNSSAASFAHSLQSKQLIRSQTFLLWLLRIQGLTHHLKAGVYEVQPGESAQSFVYRVLSGDVLQESFRIVEGTTMRQVALNLQKAPFLSYEAENWKLIQGNYPSAEGLLLADTYQYDAGSDGEELLARAHTSLQQYLERCWQQRSPGLPYRSSYELLITASILEKEASDPREKRLIAGVIVNRLQKNMPLQVDPTVIYALGSAYTGKLTRENMQVDSPFNTYRKRGLPPTPIAMVGKDAIDAAAHPENTPYLYFVAKGDGTHQFSVTYEQQKQAITRFLKK